MNKEELKALESVASDAILQAQLGYAVALDPDVADALGAFTEDALSLNDLMEDAIMQTEGDS